MILKFLKNLAVILLLFFIFIFDQSLEGVFAVYGYISLTCILIISLMFTKNDIEVFAVFLIAGLLIDWKNENLLGLTSFALISIYLLLAYARLRVSQNFIVNLVLVSGLSFYVFNLFNGFEGRIFTSVIFTLLAAITYILTFVIKKL